jgi:hypothetical protein
MPPDPVPNTPASGPRPPDPAEWLLRLTRWNLALAVLLLMGYATLIAWGVFFFRFDAKRREEQVLAAVKQRLLQDIGPLAEEVGKPPSNGPPPLLAALVEQIEQDLPALAQTVEQNGREVADHLEATIRKDLEARYQAQRGKFRAILQKEFPEVTDPAVLDRMTDQFEDAFARLIRRYHVQEYRRRIERTVQLWQAIPPAPAPPGGTKALLAQLETEVKQWVRIKVMDELLGSFATEGKQ